MKFKHSFNLVFQNGKKRIYNCNDINASIEIIDNSFIKVLISKNALIENTEPKESEDAFGFGDITIKVNKENFLISYYKGEKLLFSDRAPLSYNFENEFGNGVYHYISREKGEKVYGLGDKAGYLNKAGNSYRIETCDSMGYNAENSDPLYKHVPFYICENSAGSYGIYYKTYSDAYIDLGREHNNYYEPYKYFKCEDSELEYYVFFGNKLDILKAYSKIIGKNAFPPRWSFDYCASTMSYTDSENAQKEFDGFLELLKKYDISCSGFYLSSGYTSIGNQRCVFNWNYDKFPNPKAFIEKFRENGIEIIPNIKPAFLVTHPMYNELKERGLFIKNPDGTPFVTQFWDNLGSYLDFTNPKTKEFWKTQVKEKLLDFGITTTWNDNNEFDIKDCDALTYNNKKANALKPYLTYLMVESSYEAQKEKFPALRPFLSTRSGNAEIRRYAQTWSGDNFTSFNDLKFCHFIGLTMSLSGYYFYGHDLGGFSGKLPEKELFLRWLQHGVFEPRFTLHSWNDDKSSTMPWSYPEIIDTVREIMAQRKALIPYLYNCAYKAVSEDIPINSPEFLYYGDGEIDENKNAFMLGRDILALTVFDKGQKDVEVYLPKEDCWYLENSYFKGAQTVKVNIPALGKAKYFVRAGSVIPFNTAPYGFKSDEKLTLKVFAKESGSFESVVFWDDGNSEKYKNNECMKLKINVECNENEVVFSSENEGDILYDFDIQLIDYKKRKLIIT